MCAASEWGRWRDLLPEDQSNTTLGVCMSRDSKVRSLRLRSKDEILRVPDLEGRGLGMKSDVWRCMVVYLGF
jgi:hypothetical protein